MLYPAIATDYDGTLATEGSVDHATVVALHRYREAGGRLFLVTGRELPDLQQVCPHLSLFEAVIAENGAVYFHPTTEQIHLLGEPFPQSFVEALITKQIHPLHQGQIMISTLHPHGEAVQQIIRSQSLPTQVILNKGAVMILPNGISKASGLKFVLDRHELSPQQVAGIGDAENDRDLISSCGLGVAVGNALEDLKAVAHRVTTQPRGAGVQELIEWILSS